MSTSSHNSAKKFAIEERRRQVASMLARSMTQMEIAQKLGVDQSTISDDVKALKEMSQHFVYDLAKSDLAYYYKQSLDTTDEIMKEAWYIHNRHDDVRYKLAALKIIIQANESRAKIMAEGPYVLMHQTLENRVSLIESNQNTNR